MRRINSIFTAVDEDLSGEVLSDPLGITRLCSQLGSMLIPFLTQRSSHIRQFTLALLTYRVQNGDIVKIPENGSFSTSFILGIEQLAAYLQAIKYSDDFSGLVGKRKAFYCKNQKKTRVLLGGNGEDLIISTQHSAGACAAMRGTLKDLGIYNEYEGISDVAFSDEFLSSIDKNWNEILRRLIKKNTLIDLFTQKSCKINLTIAGGGAGKREFIDFLNGNYKKSMKILTRKLVEKDKSGGISAVRQVAEELSANSEPLNPESVLKKLRKENNDIGRLCTLICWCERLFCSIETLFESISHSKGFSSLQKKLPDMTVENIRGVRDLAVSIRDELASNKDLSDIYNFCTNFTEFRDFAGLADAIVKRHESEMDNGRKQAPWVHSDGQDIYKSELIGWSEEQQREHSKHLSKWRHSYYVSALLGLTGFRIGDE